MGWGGGVESTDLVQDTDMWRALVNAVMNLGISQNAGNLTENRLASHEGLCPMESVRRTAPPLFTSDPASGVEQLDIMPQPLYGRGRHPTPTGWAAQQVWTEDTKLSVLPGIKLLRNVAIQTHRTTVPQVIPLMTTLTSHTRPTSKYVTSSAGM